MLAMPAVLKLLKRFCKQYDTDAKAAKVLRVTPSQLSRTLSGNTNVIHARILKKLGLQAVTMYTPIGKTATKKVKVSRDATTGRVVSKAVAKANPKGTVTETQTRAVKPPAKKRVPSVTEVHRSARIKQKAERFVDEAPFATGAAERNQDIIDMANEGPVVIDITARD